MKRSFRTAIESVMTPAGSPKDFNMNNPEQTQCSSGFSRRNDEESENSFMQKTHNSHPFDV
jgi:hypothetical protein